MAAAGPTTREPHPLVSLVLVVAGVAIAVGGLRYGWGAWETPDAGFVPFLAGAAMAGFSAITVVQTLRRGWRPLGELWAGVQWHRPLIVTVCLFLYAFFLRDLGFLIATFVLTMYLYRMLEPPSWPKTVLTALATTLGFYLVFQVWLEVQLPRGLLAF
jgi:putative tricarboxylic transport membrane protein